MRVCAAKGIKLIDRTGTLIGPGDPRGRPHPVFLAWHRENCFKQ